MKRNRKVGLNVEEWNIKNPEVGLQKNYLSEKCRLYC